MTNEELQKLDIATLKEWKVELIKKRDFLDNEVNEKEIEIEKCRLKIKVAKKAFERSSIKIISNEYLKPLNDQLKESLEHRDKIKVENYNRASAIDTIIDQINRQLELFGVEVSE